MKKTKKNKKTKNNLNFNFIHKYKFIIFIMFFGVAGALLLSLDRKNYIYTRRDLRIIS